MRKSILLMICAVLTLSIVPDLYAQTINVIVSRNAPIDNLKTSDLKRIYLSKRNTFPNGGQVIPLDQPEDSAAFAQFYEKAIKKSQQQLRAYRSQLIFTGKGQPPKQVSQEELVNLVAENPATIGYVVGNVSSKAVKVILSF